MKNFRFLLFFLGAVAACGSPVIKDPKAYYSYLADPSNGLVKEKVISGIKLKLKYLPEDYLVYNASNGQTRGLQKDSSFSNSLTFILNIGPEENEGADITHLGVGSYEEFAIRLEKMAFDADQWMSLESGGRSYQPEIVKLENVNALEKSRNFIVVFSTPKEAKNDLRKTDLCFSYSDEIFYTGTSKFNFKAKDLTAIPKFKF